MHRGYMTAIGLGAIALLSLLWTHQHRADPVDPATVYEMENYLRQKECTQARIDQSNGHDVDLPEGCSEHR